MSRKCPKRNHLFLNWLRANRSRFAFQPHIVRSWKRRVDFKLKGITTALGFSFSRYSIYSRITVEVVLQGKEWDKIGYFDVGEKITDKGWMCRMDHLPENHQRWQTREELLMEHCFEPFLGWCNNQLISARWLELYELGNECTGAQLFKDQPGKNSILEKLKKECELQGDPFRGNMHLISVCKNLSDQIIIPEAIHGDQLHQNRIGTITHQRIPTCL